MSWHYEDAELIDFVHALDESELELTDWETKFIGSVLEAESFSPKQRQSLIDMISRYSKRIEWP